MSKVLKKKILLINPENSVASSLPIDLMYLASVAEEAGLEVKISDYNKSGDLNSDLDAFSPDYILAKISIPTFKSDMELLALAKSKMPNLCVIVFGEPFLTYNTNVIYENPFVDYVIIGEPELPLQDILNNVANEDILGICYAENHQGVNVKGIRNEMRTPNESLDLLPFPARHLLNNDLYKSSFNSKVQTVVQISRGVQKYCFFDLESSVLGVGTRKRAVDNIIAEIKECVDKYKIKDFYFMSENFNFDKDWAIDLCQKIIESKLQITWSTKLDINDFDDDIAKVMYKSGCRYVNLVVLSGAQDILNNLATGIKLDDIRKVVRVLKKNKIKIHNSFVVGLPWETEKTFEETVNFAVELRSDYVSFDVPLPLPGTPFFAYVMLNKLAEGNLKFDEASNRPIVRSHELTKERIEYLQGQAYKRFYKTTKGINKYLKFIKNMF